MASLPKLGLALLLIFLNVSAPVCADPVKLSRNGICHDASSPNYNQLRNHELFDSVQACLQAGGRLPRASPVGQSRADSRPSGTGSTAPQSAWHQWPLAVVAIAALALVGRLVWRGRSQPRSNELGTTEAERRAEEDARRRWQDHRRER